MGGGKSKLKRKLGPKVTRSEIGPASLKQSPLDIALRHFKAFFDEEMCSPTVLKTKCQYHWPTLSNWPREGTLHSQTVLELQKFLKNSKDSRCLADDLLYVEAWLELSKSVPQAPCEELPPPFASQAAKSSKESPLEQPSSSGQAPSGLPSPPSSREKAEKVLKGTEQPEQPEGSTMPPPSFPSQSVELQKEAERVEKTFELRPELAEMEILEGSCKKQFQRLTEEKLQPPQPPLSRTASSPLPKRDKEEEKDETESPGRTPVQPNSRDTEREGKLPQSILLSESLPEKVQPLCWRLEIIIEMRPESSPQPIAAPKFPDDVAAGNNGTVSLSREEEAAKGGRQEQKEEKQVEQKEEPEAEAADQQQEHGRLRKHDVMSQGCTPFPMRIEGEDVASDGICHPPTAEGQEPERSLIGSLGGEPNQIQPSLAGVLLMKIATGILPRHESKQPTIVEARPQLRPQFEAYSEQKETKQEIPNENGESKQAETEKPFAAEAQADQLIRPSLNSQPLPPSYNQSNQYTSTGLRESPICPANHDERLIDNPASEGSKLPELTTALQSMLSHVKKVTDQEKLSAIGTEAKTQAVLNPELTKEDPVCQRESPGCQAPSSHSKELSNVSKSQSLPGYSQNTGQKLSPAYPSQLCCQACIPPQKNGEWPLCDRSKCPEPLEGIQPKAVLERNTPYLPAAAPRETQGDVSPVQPREKQSVPESHDCYQTEDPFAPAPLQDRESQQANLISKLILKIEARNIQIRDLDSVAQKSALTQAVPLAGRDLLYKMQASLVQAEMNPVNLAAESIQEFQGCYSLQIQPMLASLHVSPAIKEPADTTEFVYTPPKDGVSPVSLPQYTAIQMYLSRLRTGETTPDLNAPLLAAEKPRIQNKCQPVQNLQAISKITADIAPANPFILARWLLHDLFDDSCALQTSKLFLPNQQLRRDRIILNHHLEPVLEEALLFGRLRVLK